MIDICPTILSEDQESYRKYISILSGFANRIHIDITDGQFASNPTIPLDQIWWPGNMRADVHVMYKQPFVYLDTFIALGAQLVIVHAEAEGDFISFAKAIHAHGIEAGVALLPETPAGVLEPAIDEIDHVLIFSGNLGEYGGEANTRLLDKVAMLRNMKPTLEIGWDGGVNDKNAKQLVDGGIDVLNVGGFIHNTDDPQHAYATLKYVTE